MHESGFWLTTVTNLCSLASWSCTSHLPRGPHSPSSFLSDLATRKTAVTMPSPECRHCSNVGVKLFAQTAHPRNAAMDVWPRQQ